MPVAGVGTARRPEPTRVIPGLTGYFSAGNPAACAQAGIEPPW